jgi:hypothetical protein
MLRGTCAGAGEFDELSLAAEIILQFRVIARGTSFLKIERWSTPVMALK